MQSGDLDLDMIDALVSAKALASAQKKCQKDLEMAQAAPLERKFQAYNPIVRIFMRTFGRFYVERKLAEEQTMQLLMMNHISDAEAREIVSKKKKKSVTRMTPSYNALTRAGIKPVPPLLFLPMNGRRAEFY